MNSLVVVVALSVVVLASGCADSSDDAGPAPAEPCVVPGLRPITAERLVEVFQSNGISLEIDRTVCEDSSHPTIAKATNAGPNGLDSEPEVLREEGFILCDLGSESTGRGVSRTQFDGERIRSVSAMNMSCAIFPSDEANAERQVAQLERALRAVVAGLLPRLSTHHVSLPCAERLDARLGQRPGMSPTR